MDKGTDYLEKRIGELRLIEQVDWSRYLHPDEQAKIKDASLYRDDLVDFLVNPQAHQGYRLPWRKADKIRICAGETSIWTGLNSARKSMMLGFVQLGLLAQGAKCCVMSFEMKPLVTLERMAHQFVGNNDPTLKALDDFIDYLRGRFWLYDQMGTVQPDRVLAVARYAIQELGCDQIVIDSLMKCQIRKDSGWDRQIEFMNALCSMSRDTNASIHLVAHAKKPSDTRHLGIPGRYDIKGTGEISDMADNVYVVHADNDPEAEHNALLIADKQRDQEPAPAYGLWFEEKNMQFKSSRNAQKLSPHDWINQQWQ